MIKAQMSAPPVFNQARNIQFILHCMKELLNNGKLKLPTEEQKKSLTTIIVPNK